MPSEGEEGPATNSVDRDALLCELAQESVCASTSTHECERDEGGGADIEAGHGVMVVDLPSVYVLGRRHVDDALWEVDDDIELTIRS